MNPITCASCCLDSDDIVMCKKKRVLISMSTRCGGMMVNTCINKHETPCQEVITTIKGSKKSCGGELLRHTILYEVVWEDLQMIF